MWKSTTEDESQKRIFDHTHTHTQFYNNLIDSKQTINAINTKTKTNTNNCCVAVYHTSDEARLNVVWFCRCLERYVFVVASALTPNEQLFLALHRTHRTDRPTNASDFHSTHCLVFNSTSACFSSHSHCHKTLRVSFYLYMFHIYICVAHSRIVNCAPLHTQTSRHKNVYTGRNCR